MWPIFFSSALSFVYVTCRRLSLPQHGGETWTRDREGLTREGKRQEQRESKREREEVCVSSKEMAKKRRSLVQMQ